jgi:hypothetical protein
MQFTASFRANESGRTPRCARAVPSWLLTGSAAILFVLGISTPVHADYAIATFVNVSPGENVGIPIDGNTHSTTAGVFNFTDASGIFTGSFSGFCIDITQPIFPHLPVMFSVAPLSGAPVDGSHSTGMGTLRANLIAELWYNNFDSIGTNASKAAAFQLAIWEIVNETHTNRDGTLALSLNSGSFYATDHDSATLTTANTWLSLLNPNGTGPMASDLYALTNSTYQDYVVEGNDPPAAPVPSSLVLCLIGIGGLVLFLYGIPYLSSRSRPCLAPNVPV